MAKFNPETPFGAPNTIGASRGQIPDRSLGIALSGAGNLLTQGIDVAENRTKAQIDNDAFNARQEIDKEFNIPPAVSRASDDLNLLTRQFKQGIINDTLYHLRAGQVTKAIRLKYPKWRKYVDQAIRENMGFDPANAIRQDLFEEYNSQRSSADKDLNSMRRFVFDHMGEVSMSDEAILAVNNGDWETAFFAIQSQIAEQQQYEAAFNAAKFKKDVLDPKELDEAVTEVRKSSEQAISKVLFDTLGVHGGVVELNKDAIRFSNSNPTAEEIQAYGQKAADFLNRASVIMDKKLNTKVPGTDKKVRDVLGETKSKQMFDAFMKPFEDVLASQNMLINPAAVVGGAAKLIDMRNTITGAKLQELYPVLATTAALEAMGMDPILIQVIMNDPKVSELATTAVATFIKAVAAGKIVGDPDPRNANPSVARTIVDPSLTQDGPITSKDAQQRLDLLELLMSSKEIPLQDQINIAKAFYATNPKNILDLYTPDGSRQKALLTLINTDRSKFMVDNFYGRNTFEIYVDFMIGSLAKLPDMMDLTGEFNAVANQMKEYTTLTFDPSAFEFDVEFDEDVPGRSGAELGIDATRYDNAVTNINLLMSLFKPIAQARGVTNEKFIQEIFATFKLELPRRAKPSQFWENLGDAVRNLLDPTSSGASAIREVEKEKDFDLPVAKKVKTEIIKIEETKSLTPEEAKKRINKAK